MNKFWLIWGCVFWEGKMINKIICFFSGHIWIRWVTISMTGETVTESPPKHFDWIKYDRTYCRRCGKEEMDVLDQKEETPCHNQ